MEPKEQEKITSDALEAEKIGMKTFNYLCKMNILFCCKTMKINVLYWFWRRMPAQGRRIFERFL